MKNIDIVYVNYFSSDDTIRSICSLKTATSNAGIRISVHIVDNSFVEAPREESCKLYEFSDNFKDDAITINYMPSDENHGFGKACNKATKLGNAPIIIFANCDTDFRDTNAKDLIKMINLLNDKKISVIGPKVLSETGLLHASSFSFDPVSIALKPMRHIRKIGSRFTRAIPNYSSIKKRIDRITYEGLSSNNPSYVDWVSGCFMVVDRKFFEDVGGFDERYFMYLNTDLCNKTTKQKCTIRPKNFSDT